MSTLIREVHLQNFKSIADIKLTLGRVNVLIGENGCGKSNFLEALAFASAGAASKLDNEFLASRGIRVTEPRFMRSAFVDPQSDDIRAEVGDSEGRSAIIQIHTADGAFPRWVSAASAEPVPENFPLSLEDNAIATFSERLANIGGFKGLGDSLRREAVVQLLTPVLFAAKIFATHPFAKFAIFSPENTSLRAFATEGQMLPVGVKGDGLFRLLKVLASDADRWAELKQNLHLLQWFDDAEIPADQLSMEHSFRIKDKYLAQDLAFFDQRSANEGFLFLLFYFALVISPDTPPFFAIDNVDASLNPKTATVLTSRLASLAAKHDKQIILTTHSPAVLDGLDLKDDEQRLFVFFRNKNGETRVRRVMPPQPLGNEAPIKLSEAFMRGMLGGLPQNF